MGIGSLATRALVDPLLAALFPAECPACGGGVDRPSRAPLCGACWERLPRHSATCLCGAPLAAVSAACGRCRRQRSPFSRGLSLGPHQGALRALVHALKYGGRHRVAGRLAERLLCEPGSGQLFEPGVVIVPVPLHPRRQRERGFNQSLLLAEALARRTGCRLSPGALVRRRETLPQTGLTAALRRRNVSQAFAVRKRADVFGRACVLVDDVFTTGATTFDCARALKQAGASEVRLVTVARAGL